MSTFSDVTRYPEYHDLSDPELQEFSKDWAKGLITGGLTSGYSTLDAVARGDWEEVAYWSRVELAVLGTQYVMLKALNFVQGPKYAMSFHSAHASMGTARGLILRATARAWAPVAIHYGMKHWLGETDQSNVIHGYDVTREQRIQQYSGY